MPSDVQNQRKELADKLPALGVRVFALQGKSYPGCGYHWALLRTLGALLQTLNDFDAPFAVEDLVVCEVLYEDLLERVQTAEATQ